MKPCIRCNWEASPVHTPCCSSHGHALCCACYSHTHFVETGCCKTEREIVVPEESPGGTASA